MEAANAAHEKGHQVVLLEETATLGGQLNLASIPPGRREIERFREFLVNRLRKSGLRVILGREAVKQVLESDRPDVLVLATGARPRTFDIPGLEKSRALTAWDVLSEAKKVEGPCLVLGAGLVGCETADFLSEKGKKVFIVEVLPEMAAGADGDTKAYFDLKFRKKNVKVYTSTRLVKLDGKTAILKHRDDEIKVEAETVVFAVGAAPDEGPDSEFLSSIPKVIKVGDCTKPRIIMDAVQEGFDAGRSIE